MCAAARSRISVFSPTALSRKGQCSGGFVAVDMFVVVVVVGVCVCV